MDMCNGCQRICLSLTIKKYDESTLPATAIGMVSSDYKECFQAEYKQLRIRYEKLKRMRQYPRPTVITVEVGACKSSY